MRNQILQFLMREIEDYNEQLECPIDVKQGESCVLFGKGSVIDSIELVSLIIAIEQAAQDCFGKPIALVDERAMSQKNSPFRTVGALADYIVFLLEAEV